MVLIYAKRFEKELLGLNDPAILKKVKAALISFAAAASLSEVPDCEKMQGPVQNAYRVRCGNYRMGLYLQEDGTLLLARLLHRREIYRFFP